MDVKVPLIDDATVTEGASAEVDFFGRPVVVVRKDGLTRAYANVCPHLGGPLKLSASWKALRVWASLAPRHTRAT